MKFKRFLLFAPLAFFCGCSSITRPPPAAAFMDSYGKKGVTIDMSFSYYAGQLDNGRHEKSCDDDYDYSCYDYTFNNYEEWWGDLQATGYWNIGYFTLGGGNQTFTPFAQLGFVSPYVGFTTWSNFYIPAFQYSGGAELIEQIPLDSNWKIGFTEHISRNGREAYYGDVINCEGVCFGNGLPYPGPKFYTEIGGGFYLSRKIGTSAKIALEARYGRDLDENRNRIAITVDFWGLIGTSPVGKSDNK